MRLSPVAAVPTGSAMTSRLAVGLSHRFVMFKRDTQCVAGFRFAD
jgi:hypothetical protein